MTLKTRLLSKRGLQIGFRDVGSGPPVVLIHGVGMQSAAWAPQIEALSRFYRVLAIDMPGHGESARLPAASELPDYVGWLRDAVTELALGPVNLIGHSMGALIAGGFAVEHPELTLRVALLNGVFRRDAAARAAVKVRADQIRAGKIDLETPLNRWFGDSLIERAARDTVAEWLAAVDAAGYATAYAAFAQGDATYAERYREIACPFLAITGGDDPNSTSDMSQEMALRVQNGKAVCIPGHRHMVNLTAPEIVNRHLQTWMKQSAFAEVSK